MIDQDKIEEGTDELEMRKDKGERAMLLVWGSEPHEDDRYSAATDAISDILTVMVGPAGVTVEAPGPSYNVEHDGEALDKARELLDDALRSWEGDAEDYIVHADETVDLDFEHLTELYVAAFTATNQHDAGYARGRAHEFRTQNAIDEETARRASNEASKRIHGDGPSTGAQC